MPQDELWATSARLTGWSSAYKLDAIDQGRDVLMFTPTYSKKPSSFRASSYVFEVPSYMRWTVPTLIRAGHDELLGGLAVNVPGVVRAELRDIQAQFREGSAH